MCVYMYILYLYMYIYIYVCVYVCVYIYTFFLYISFHDGLSQDIEYSSLRHIVGPCCNSICNSLGLLIPNSQSIPPLTLK